MLVIPHRASAVLICDHDKFLPELSLSSGCHKEDVCCGFSPKGLAQLLKVRPAFGDFCDVGLHL